MKKKNFIIYIIVIAIVIGALSFGVFFYLRYQRLAKKTLSFQELIKQSSSIKQTEQISLVEKFPEKEIFKKNKEFVIELIRKQPNFNFYLAAISNDVSKCNNKDLTSDAQEDCKDSYNLYKFIKSIAKRDCSYLDSPFSGFCVAIVSKKCESLKENERLLCESFLEKNVEKCISGLRGLNVSIEDPKIKCLRMLKFYQGLAENNPNVCKEFSGEDEAGKWLCQGLVGKAPILKEIEEEWPCDIAYFMISREQLSKKGGKSGGLKEKKSLDFCQKIKNEFIKKCCLDTKIDIQTLFKKLFYPSF